MIPALFPENLTYAARFVPTFLFLLMEPSAISSQG